MVQRIYQKSRALGGRLSVFRFIFDEIRQRATRISGAWGPSPQFFILFFYFTCNLDCLWLVETPIFVQWTYPKIVKGKSARQRFLGRPGPSDDRLWLSEITFSENELGILFKFKHALSDWKNYWNWESTEHLLVKAVGQLRCSSH